MQPSSGSDAGIPNAAINVTRGHKVDLLTTKNLNMKGRKVTGAAPASDSNDYVILDQLNSLKDELTQDLATALVGLAVVFKKAWTTILNLVVSKMAPPADSVIAIQFLKADQVTQVAAFDTLNSRFGVGGGIYSLQGDHATLPNVPFIRIQYDPTGYLGYYGDLVVYDPVANAYLPLAIRADPLTLGYVGSRLAFFDTDKTHAVGKQFLNFYTPYGMGGSFVGLGSGAVGSPYAQVNDLNNLRIGYETLRIMCEDLRVKLQATTLVG